MSFRNETYRGVRQVNIDNFATGSITIEPGADGEVESSLNSSDEALLGGVSVRQDRDQLRYSLPNPGWRPAPLHLRLGVPPGIQYQIKTGAAEISITADIGRTKIASGSGDVTVGRADDLDCSTGSGSIFIARLGGNSARVVSGSGEIVIEEVYCPLTAKSAAGDVVVRQLHGSSLQANSGSGDIAVNSTSGSVGLRSASGSLTVGIADELPAWLDLSSVTGEVRIALETTAPPVPGEPFVAVHARTASGDIAVYRA